MCVPEVHERVQYLVSRAYVLRKYHTQMKKGEARSRVKSNDDHGYAITTGIWPGPLRSAGGFEYFFNLFFLGLTMSWDLIR